MDIIDECEKRAVKLRDTYGNPRYARYVDGAGLYRDNVREKAGNR